MFPDVVRIEPAGSCNFRCTHCPVGREGGKRGILTYGAFVSIMNILPLVPRVLVLYHGGEPFLNREIFQMLAYAKSVGVEKTVLNTNASLINSTMDFSDLDEMRVSFDGESAQDNNDIRRNGRFAVQGLSIRNISVSIKRPKEIVIYNIRKGTDEPAEYLKEYFRGYPVKFRGGQMREWARVNSPEKPNNGARYCRNLFETFTVLADGSVPMCCEDLLGEQIQGNVFTHTPLEIWNNMQTLRDNFAKGNHPQLCKSCWVLTGYQYAE